MFQFIFDDLLLYIENSFHEDRKYLVFEQIVLCFFFDENDESDRVTKTTKRQKRQSDENDENDNYEHAPKMQFAPSSASLFVCLSVCLFVLLSL